MASAPRYVSMISVGRSASCCSRSMTRSVAETARTPPAGVRSPSELRSVVRLGAPGLEMFGVAASADSWYVILVLHADGTHLNRRRKPIGHARVGKFTQQAAAGTGSKSGHGHRCFSRPREDDAPCVSGTPGTSTCQRQIAVTTRGGPHVTPLATIANLTRAVPNRDDLLRRVTANTSGLAQQAHVRVFITPEEVRIDRESGLHVGVPHIAADAEGGYPARGAERALRRRPQPGSVGSSCPVSYLAARYAVSTEPGTLPRGATS